MNSAPLEHHQDKTGDALKVQRFQMLEDIAKELLGDVVFPTYFDTVLRLRKVLQDPDQNLTGIAAAISIEPLISSKVLHLANSVAFNPAGNEVRDLKSAINRLGLNTVRTTAMAIVMTQLLRAKGMAEYAEITRALWNHSVSTAAAARVIAKTQTRLNPDEAMLAGLVHDLGAFYMLYRATQYEELRERPDSIKYLMIQWHESIGVSLLNALGLPEEIVDAVVDHDHPRPTPHPIRTFNDIVYVANMLAGGHFQWLLQDEAPESLDVESLKADYEHLKPEIEALSTEMRANFG